MAARANAFVTPNIIRWGRQRANASRGLIAERLNVDEDKVAQWEKGEGHPTMRQAKQLANILDIPFGYLFFSKPPEEQIAIPDFRTVEGKQKETVSLDLFDVLNDVLWKQEWYREFLTEEGMDRLPFVGKFTLPARIIDVANEIRDTLHVEQARLAAQGGFEEFITQLIANAENLGILIMRSGIVRGNTHRSIAVSDFRGFAISDPVAPVVFINGADAKAAQIFTLVHELTHIWLGASAISAPDLIEAEQHQAVETFCNGVAAEVLAPEERFSADWQSARSIDDNLKSMAQRFRVSSLVVLRRAYDLRKIAKKEYLQRFNSEYKRFLASEEQSGGGNYYLNVPSWNSKTLTTTVVRAALDGRVLFREAAQLLNIKVPTIHELAKRL
jgi:Zn-dependent peptidase ImmA (M78 family)/DNA-binding XRE family transcriptional regulator